MPDTLTVEEVDPSTVLLGSNVRKDPELTEDFINSVRTLGVQTPCRSVRTATGEIKLMVGSRRRAAAIVAGRTLPVYVIGPEDITKQGQADRLFAQWDENEQRAPLPAQDKAAFVQDLLELKISPAQIKKRAGLDKDAVDLARKVAKSARVMAAAPVEDLEMAAALAEFEIAGDTEAYETLTETIPAGPGQFRHVAQQLADSQAERFGKRDLLADLAGAGITVLGEDEHGRMVTADGTNISWQNRITDWKSADGELLTAENHAACPGHAAYLHRDTMHTDDGWVYAWKPVYVCTDPEGIGHQARYSGSGGGKADTGEAAKEKAAKLRKIVIDNNRLWRAACIVRQAWLRELLARKAVPDDAVPIIRGAMTGCWLDRWDRALAEQITSGHDLACELLGLPKVDAAGKPCSGGEALAVAMRAASPDRQDVMALAMVLAAWETRMIDDTWRRYVKGTVGYRHRPSASLEGKYLLLLQGWGYDPSDIEKLVAAATAAAAKGSGDE